MSIPLLRETEVEDALSRLARAAERSLPMAPDLSSIVPSIGREDVDVARPAMALGVRDHQSSSMALMVERALVLQRRNTAPRTGPVEEQDSVRREDLQGAVSERSSLTSPTGLGRGDDVIPMAPGIGGFNIDAAPSASTTEPAPSASAPGSVVAAREVETYLALVRATGLAVAANVAPRTGPLEKEDPVCCEDLPLAVSELSPVTSLSGPETGDDVIAMAPGVGGFNIDPPPGVSATESVVAARSEVEVYLTDLTVASGPTLEANIAPKHVRGGWLLFDPDPLVQPRWIGALSFIFSLVAVVGLTMAGLVTGG